MTTRKLSTSTKIFWGVGQIGEGVKNAAFNAFLLFYYNQILGVSATLTSIALGIAILCDAISDPVAGSISDRFQSRWGRRHPFMAASAAPLAISLFLLFSPPDGMSELFYFGWVLVLAISVRTFLTLYHIPHLALGAEMASDYEDRNMVFSIGLFFGAIAGYFFYPVMLRLVFPPQENLPNGMYNPDGYPVMAATAAIIAFSAIMVCVIGTRKEIPYLSSAIPAREAFGLSRVFNELKVAFSSPSYRTIFFGLLLSTIVLSVEGAFSPFMGIHFWGMETDQMSLVVLGVLAGLPFGLLVSSYLVKVLDKKWCLIVPAAISIVNGNVLIVLRLLEIMPANGHEIILPLLTLQAFVGAVVTPVVFVTLNSMFADITDELELVTGERQEGLIYSARAFAGKAASALGTMLGGLALDLIAFPKKALPGTVDTDVIFSLGLVQGPVTSIFTLSALSLYLGYNLTREKHSEIMSELEERRLSKEKPSLSTPSKIVDGTLSR